jgi:prepilin-type N-terminal cleavage/methylation domain-containing protein
MLRLSRKAFSLIELLVGVSLFSLLLIVVFAFFRFGTRAFQTASQRQGVQSDALRVMDGLQQEMKRTAADSVTVESGVGRTRIVGAHTLPRHAVCFGGLKNWQDLASSEDYDLASGQPRWNRYWVFYATRDKDRGELLRLHVNPVPPPVAAKPMPNSELLDLIKDNPQLNRYRGNTPAVTQLARNVYEFSVSPVGVEKEEFRISLKLQEVRLPRPGESAVRREGLEIYQLVMNVRPENTFPRIEP